MPGAVAWLPISARAALLIPKGKFGTFKGGHKGVFMGVYRGYIGSRIRVGVPFLGSPQ